jgi:hypothetical protein
VLDVDIAIHDDDAQGGGSPVTKTRTRRIVVVRLCAGRFEAGS